MADVRVLFNDLLRRVNREYQNKLSVLIYLVGTSDNTVDFLQEDKALGTLVARWSINLSPGSKEEFAEIRCKILDRIEGAYHGYAPFTTAWQELQHIPITSAPSLRGFCQEFASAVLAVHERYFSELPEQRYEGEARRLVEAQCRRQWSHFLQQASYSLVNHDTTTHKDGHNFDCLVELKHNSKTVAHAYGEAKNYDLLTSHLSTFEDWLKDVKFAPGRAPPDLAFFVAPSCSSLLRRKVELAGIQFIQREKHLGGTTTDLINEPIYVHAKVVDINAANRQQIGEAFEGTYVRGTTLDKLISARPFDNLEHLQKKLKLSETALKKLREKLTKNQICFGVRPASS